MRAGLAVAGVALLAAGCVSTTGDHGSASGAMASAPTPVPGRDWHFAQYGGNSTLAYGVAESDDVSVMLICGDLAGRVYLSRDVPHEAPAEFVLESGGEILRLAASSEPSLMTDGQSLASDAAWDEPVFRRFRSLGWLAVWTGDQREAYAPHPGSEGAAERFFATCG